MTTPQSTPLSDTLLPRLQRVIRETIDPLLSGARKVALIEFPAHSNVGDSAIWLGEMAYLQNRHGLRPAHTSDMYSYSQDRLRTAMDEGVILIHGGGSLGDVWRLTLEAKIRVLEDFPDFPIIQLPQTLEFQDPARLDEYRRAVARHPRFTLLARDKVGFDLATSVLDCDVRLCPDMALWLQLQRGAPPRSDLFVLRRTDKEAAMEWDQFKVAPHIVSADWIDEPSSLTVKIERTLTSTINLYPRKLAFLEGQLLAWRNRAASIRLKRGRALLSSGRVVVTDRLHGHILCVLMGIPHVLLDNSYGKLRRFYDSWTSDCPDARFATSMEEALDIARELARTR